MTVPSAPPSSGPASSRTASSRTGRSLAADRLGAPALVAFAITAAAPLLVIGGVVTVGWATAGAATGITGYPLAYLIIAALLGVFTIGYLAMSRRINNAGAFYSFIAQGLGRPCGVAASFVAFVSYNLLQVGLYGFFGATLGELVGGDGGLAWWVYALLAWATVGCLGVLRVDVNGAVLLCIVVLEVLVVAIFDVVFLANPAGGTVSVSTFAPDNLFLPGVGAILVTVFTSFVGFEAAAVYSEESRNRRRTVPVATYLALVFMVAFYAVTSWAIAVTVGDDRLIARAEQQGPEMMFGVAAERLGGAAIADTGIVLLITSVFAAMLSYHNTVARYTFALAREGVLPRWLARTGSRSGAPRGASLLQSAIGGGVVIAYAVGGWDPLEQLFFWVGMTGGFGVMLLITTTSVAVVAYFLRNRGEENLLTRLLAPAVSAVAFVVVVYFAVLNYPSLLGVADDDPLGWMFPAALGVVAVAGFLWARWLGHRRPEVYAGIGLGAVQDHGVRPVSVGERR